MTRMGQKTGTLNPSKKVMANETHVALVAQHQNYSNLDGRKEVFFYLELGQSSDKRFELAASGGQLSVGIVLI